MILEYNSTFTTSISSLINSLRKPAVTPTVFVGFDGFIDEIIHVVDIRYSSEEYQRITTIKDYADRIARGSGMSTNIEMVSQQVKMGGNGPILANALLNYSVDIMYMGSVGFPHLHPVFDSLKRCRELICLCPPAMTDALEFFDGKIISSKLTSLNAVNWKNITEQCALPQLIKLFESCDYIVFSNWSMIIHMNHIWEFFLQSIAPKINSSTKSVFFDFADPEKRTKSDLNVALGHIINFTKSGFRVTLSMNLKEACEICEALGKTISDYKTADIRDLLDFLSDQLGLNCTVIHLIDRACCCHEHAIYEVSGPYCNEPKLTTGAGDNFNAGFLYGQAQGFSLVECLITGCATSGYYVRHAKSPCIQELIDFLCAWRNNPDSI